MIDWGNTPANSVASFFLPGVDADEILALSARLYGLTTLRRVDDHTLACDTGGITWLPLPPDSGAAYAGLMTIDLPSSVKRGQSFKVVVRQITSGPPLKAPPPPPVINAEEDAIFREGKRRVPEARRTHGTFQITIPVSTKAQILPSEERAYSVLSWIRESIPHDDRWRAVFEKYVGTVGDRVKALGGDPGRIKPSPDGSGVKGVYQPGPEPYHPRHVGEERLTMTGKVDGLVYDRFGDFEGFILDTEDGERRFTCREVEIEEVVRRAWAARVRTSVVVERDDPHRPEAIILRSPPPPHHA